MSKRTTRRRFLSGGVAAAIASLAGCTAITPFVGRQIETTEQFAVDDVDSLSVSTDRGSITIRTADREDVFVEAVKQSSSASADLDQLHLRSSRDQGRLKLYSKWEGDSSLFGSDPQLNLNVTVPRGVAVRAAETSTGTVDIEGTSGDLQISTSTGSITAADIDGAVDASASTGSITVERATGTVTASASTGSVKIRDPGSLGNITTSTGSIDVDIPALDGDVRLEASTGSITARIAPDLDANLDASTSTGSITMDGVDLQEEQGGQRERRGQFGDGGPALVITTSTGSIRIRALD